MTQKQAEDFDRAVDSFLAQERLRSIRHIIDRDLVDQFFAVPTIGAYLTRPTSEVAFDAAGEPILESAHEKAFYEACRFWQEGTHFRKASKPFPIPYRAEVSLGSRQSILAENTAFYDSGTSELALKVTHRMLEQHGHSFADSNFSVFTVCNIRDIYQVGGALRTLQGQYTTFDNARGILRDAAGKNNIAPRPAIVF